MHYLFTWTFVTCVSIGFSQNTMVKVTENPVTREYKILFSSTEHSKATIKLLTSGGEVAQQEEFLQAAFMKVYSLKNSSLGKYTWVIEYGQETYRYDFEIMNEKKLIRESIVVEMDELYNLSVEIKPYNTLPVNIFLYDGSGKQLEFLFWEPTASDRRKTFQLSKYDAYDIRVEILQKGDVIINQTVKLY